MSDRFIDGLPWWVVRLNELSGHFTRQGLGGLLDHHNVTNVLGKALALGEVTSDELHAWLIEQAGKKTPAIGSQEYTTDPWAAYHSDPRAFWEQCWEEILQRKINVPAVPKLKGKTKKAIEKYKLMLVFLPVITEDEYTEGFVKPAWGRYLDSSQIERRHLPGKWVLVETIAKPNWDDPQGYGEDPLGKDLNLTTRFKISWDHLTATIMPTAAKLYGLPRRAVHHSTAEEWNLIGNLFNWLKANRSMDLPDLGSTNSWEWCLNAFASSDALVVGDRGHGGLADVSRDWRGYPRGPVGFRLLAQF